MPGIGNEQLAVSAPEEIVGVAAGKKADWGFCAGWGVEGLLVRGENEGFADWGADGREGGCDGCEGGFGFCGEDASPFREGCSGGGSEDVEIAAGEL